VIRSAALTFLAALVLGGGVPPLFAQIPDTLAGEPYLALSGRRAQIRFVRPDSLLAVRVLELVDGQPPLPGLPITSPDGVVVLLAHGPEAFDQATGGTVPEWRAGVAIPAVGMLVIPSAEGRSLVDGEGRRTLRHEWAHLGLHGFLGDLRVPRWFDEGYAQWASGGFETAEAWRLRVLLALGRAPSMDSLTLRWPAGREEARTAYLLAASAVTFMLEPSGERGLRIFLDRWKAQRSFDSAFTSTFGYTPGRFEEEWQRHVRARYGWLFVLSHSAVFWGVLALVLLFMARVRRVRNREKLARLRAAEPPDEPAYWEVDPDRPEPAPPPGGISEEP